MVILEHYFSNIEDHLSIDEQLLSDVSMIQNCVLRIWETTQYAVVMGKGNQLDTEVNEMACQRDGVPIVRRSSGGGAVVLGPGCLNYSLIAPLNGSDHWNSIQQTTKYVMDNHAKALSTKLDNIAVAGISDLTYKGKKYSGNAQRRTRNGVLFHGTFLYNFDIQKVEKYLKLPSKQPEYRENKSHTEFIVNLPLKKTDITRALKACWRI